VPLVADDEMSRPPVVAPTPVSAEGELVLRGVGKTFSTGRQRVPVLDGLDLNVAAGEIVTLIGGSGTGKSTLLRIIAGLERADRGTVRLGTRSIDRPGRDRGMVFQDPRLLPWLTVRGNIAFGLGGGAKSDHRRAVDDHIRLVGLSGFEDAYPSQLSGGMAQRVGLARAMVNRPQVLLLGEPFGALDALTRLQMQSETLRLWQAERCTMVLVTHDIDEAIYLGDRVVVLSGRPGKIGAIYPVPLARPRDRSDPVFGQLRRVITDVVFAPGHC
jgi:sulfonate transport system ATP-binding protein